MITSADNARIKEVIRLNTKSKERRERGLFVAEGRKLFLETPPGLREQVFVSASFAENGQELLRECRYEVVDDRLFLKLCDTRTPQGILTVARIPRYTREDLLKGKDSPLLLMLEDLQDPGNVGTILRTAEAAGVTGVFMSAKCADVFQPKVIRATMGSIFRVPFCVEQDLCETAGWLRKQNVRIYAAVLEGSELFFQNDYQVPSAFMIGNEGNGLSKALAQEADQRVRIPMSGSVESLNAAVAAAVFLYEAKRQRIKV